MSAAARQEAKEPSLLAIGLLAGLTALLGAVLGFVFLASFEPKAYADAEERQATLEAGESEAPELVRSTNYYFSGAVGGASHWRPARRALLRGERATVTVTTRGLNAWFDAEFGGLAPPGKDDQSSIMVEPEVPVAHLRDGRLQLATPVKLTVFGREREVVVIGEGRFADGPAPAFRIERLRFNSAPAPMAAMFGSSVMRRLSAAFRKAEEFGRLSDAWRSVHSAEIEGDTLRLTIR